MQIKDYKRIIIVGSSGSGKSHLAKKLAQLTGYPLIHLDNEYWQTNWVKTPRASWIEKQKKMIAGERWIIDGNYDGTLEIRYEAADCIIFLDINRYVCLWSAFRRHGKKRSDLPHDCPEKIDKEFLEFLKWIWDFKKKGRIKILELNQQYEHKPIQIIRSRREVKKWLEELRNIK